MSTRPFVLALVAALALPALVAASPKQEAKKHVAKATAAHKAGNFAEALQELQVAYTLDPQPDLLYAIGQVHVKLGQCADAVHAYEQFLATNPPAGPANAAHEAIATCKAQEPPAPPPPPPPAPVVAPPPPPPPPPPHHAAWYSDKLGDVLVGAGVVSGVVGAMFYRSALHDLDQADHATSYDAQHKLVDDAHGKRTFAVVFAVGGAAAITAGVLHYLHHDGSEHVSVAPTAGGGAVTWTGRF